jgi:sensor histidine kinase YesM
MEKYKFIFSDQKRYRLQRHLFFWTFWWIFFAFLYSFTVRASMLPDFRRLPVSSVDALIFMIPHMFLSYMLMYFVVPKFVFKGKYAGAGVFVLLLFFVTACISLVVARYILPPIHKAFFSIKDNYDLDAPPLSFLLAGLRGAITVGGIAAAIKLMKYWYVKEQRNLQLQKENAEAGLQILKAQVHPHFLFNTLNNIYAYTQNVSPVASKMITRLSDILRYTLQEGTKPLVPLRQELQMIQDYISLEEIRYGNRLELHIQLPENTNGLYIAPLLLLPLVENCFKHGTSHVLDQPWIHLQISIAENQMQMKLLNGKALKIQEQRSTGIGLKNVQKRLALLYPGKHELSITNEAEVFIVNLKLELIIRKEDLKKESRTEVMEYA